MVYLSECCASLNSLNGRYGVGYHMIIEKAPSSTAEKVADVVNLMTSHVDGAKCVLDAGAELSFILPVQETKSFPPLFQELEGITYILHYLLHSLFRVEYCSSKICLLLEGWVGMIS